MIRLLVLGGGVFVGHHIVEEAVSAGWQVTTFSRGRRPQPRIENVCHLYGDRRSLLDALSAGRWDGVVDTSGYTPAVVKHSAEVLSSRVGTYAFVSSLSTYASSAGNEFSEETPVSVSWDPSASPRDQRSYGLLKAASEIVVREQFPSNHLITRLGLAVGPLDPTGQLTYWIERMIGGGQILAPSPSSEPIQFIDARDHAKFVLSAMERGVVGTFNVTSPPDLWSMRDVLLSCATFSRPDSTICWVPERVLYDYHVRPWVELPLWRGDGRGIDGGLSTYSVQKAQAEGLRNRGLADTCTDIHQWVGSISNTRGPARFMRPDKERLVLCASLEDGMVNEVTPL